MPSIRTDFEKLLRPRNVVLIPVSLHGRDDRILNIGRVATAIHTHGDGIDILALDGISDCRGLSFKKLRNSGHVHCFRYRTD